MQKSYTSDPLVSQIYSGLKKIGTTFSDYYLFTCTNGVVAFQNYTSNAYWHFTYSKPTITTGSVQTNPVGGLAPNCGTGSHNIQIQSIMVR